MQSKSTLTPTEKQGLPAGISPSDHNIEFVGVPDSKKVLWFQNGNSHQWKHLPEAVYNALEELYLSDLQAKTFFGSIYKYNNYSTNRFVEIYTYYMYGQLDSQPDVVNGELQSPENFRESKDCPSLKFDNKYIDIDGVHLSQRDLQILDDVIEGMPDKMIAHRLGITQGTFDFHKKNLFIKLGVDSKVGLAVKSLKNNLTCVN